MNNLKIMDKTFMSRIKLHQFFFGNDLIVKVLNIENYSFSTKIIESVII